MASINTRIFISVVILMLFAGISYTLRYNDGKPEIASDEFINSIPYRIGNWNGTDLPLQSIVYKILETEAVIHRNYVTDRENRVLLSIVHYKDTKVDFHAPESCLGGLGQHVEKRVIDYKFNNNGSAIKIETAEISSYDNNRRLLSYYFYKVGGSLDQNYIRTRLKIAYNKLFKQDASASLIRITTDTALTNEKAKEVLNRFLRDLIPIIQN